MASTSRYHQPNIDPQTRDFTLDKGGRLVMIADSDAVKQTSWMRIVSRLASYVYDIRYGSKLYQTLKFANIEAIRLLAKSYIVRALRVEQRAGRITFVQELVVTSITRSGVNWDITLQTEFDLTVHLSS